MVRFLLLAGSKGGGVLDACVDSGCQVGVVERKWNLLDIEVAMWTSIEAFSVLAARYVMGWTHPSTFDSARLQSSDV